ncbi:uncharacterized protein METZ01_LOCUS443881, partial [marine metagenome]
MFTFNLFSYSEIFSDFSSDKAISSKPSIRHFFLNGSI